METKENIMLAFEREVYKLISMCLSENETLLFDEHFDFCAPMGVKKLEWEKETFIEVKYRLMPYSFEKIKYNFDLISPRRLIVICHDERDIPIPIPDFRLVSHISIPGRPVDFLSYGKLLKKVESLNLLGSGLSKEEIDDADRKVTIGKDEYNIVRAKNALKNDRVSLFLGAGVSISADIVDWENLLKKLCAKRNLGEIENKNHPVDEITKGRCIIDSYKKEDPERKKLKNEIEQESDTQKKARLEKELLKQDEELPDGFYDDMRNILYANTHPSELIESIANLITKCKIESIISYNYDDLVEQEINRNQNKYHIKCRPIYDKSGPIEDGIRYIYHVHGFLSNGSKLSKQSKQSKEIILGEKEYHKVYQDSYNWSNVEQLHALNRSKCFFIGLSMTDPNLRRLLDISKDKDLDKAIHYVFLSRKEYDVSFMENTMLSFGINCIWYDNHKDLPDLLRSLLQE